MTYTPLTPEAAAKLREARGHLSAVRSDINLALSIAEQSAPEKIGQVIALVDASASELITASNALRAAAEANGAVTEGDSGGDNDTATDKPPPRENDTGP